MSERHFSVVIDGWPYAPKGELVWWTDDNTGIPTYARSVLRPGQRLSVWCEGTPVDVWNCETSGVEHPRMTSDLVGELPEYKEQWELADEADSFNLACWS